MKALLAFLAISCLVSAAPVGIDRAVIIPGGTSTVAQTVATLNEIGAAMNWGSGGTAWGSITGTLANQVDLQAALNAKGTSNFSGVYADLTGKPTLGTAASTDSAAYATAAQGALAGSALQPTGNGSALTGLTKSQVGLANVDNTADSAKPVSTATQTALDGKLATNGNGSALTGLTKAQVGLGSADNTADSAKSVASAATLTTPRTINGASFNGSANITVTAAGSTLSDNVPVTKLNSGTAASATTYWRGDGTWVTPPSGGATIAYKSADQTLIGTAYADVTSTGLAVAANTNYFFEFYLIADADAVTTGIDVAVNGPASPTSINYEQVYWTSATVRTERPASAYDANTASTASNGATRAIYRVRGILRNGANAGTLIARTKRENVGSGPNIRAGSFGRLTTMP